MKKRKRIIVVAIVATAITALIVICSIRLIFGSKYDLANVDLGEGRSVQMWAHHSGLRDWNPDVPYPYIYYRVTQFDKVIVPQTWLGLDYGYRYNIKTAFTEDRTLVCIYDTNLWNEGLFIILDTTSGESWPRLNDDEVFYDLLVKKKWIDRYNRLLLENPDLPQYFAHFER